MSRRSTRRDVEHRRRAVLREARWLGRASVALVLLDVALLIVVLWSKASGGVSAP